MALNDFAKQRRSERHGVTTFIWYKVVGSSTDEPDETCEGVARSCDISRHGVGIVTSRALQVGVLLFLEIVIPQGNISVLGTVMHCTAQSGDGFRSGVRLEIVPPNDRPILARMAAR